MAKYLVDIKEVRHFTYRVTIDGPMPVDTEEILELVWNQNDIVSDEDEPEEVTNVEEE